MIRVREQSITPLEDGHVAFADVPICSFCHTQRSAQQHRCELSALQARLEAVERERQALLEAIEHYGG